jgi:hypothetical protein
MPETEVTPKPSRPIEYRQPKDGVARVYSNNVMMSSTTFDIRLFFGEVIEITDDKAIVEQSVQVTMTWLEAKILADFLQANVKTYEDKNGPLKLPIIADKIIVPETFPAAK